MARVLVIEDDRRIADLVRLYLRNDGHEVVLAHDGREGVRLAAVEEPDVVVLDLMLPGLHGRDACRAIRSQRAPGAAVPIIMLTALDDERDVVEGLDAGADDYVTKPFNPNVLVARVRAALRRAKGPAGVVREITVGDLVIIPESRGVMITGERVDVRAKEFDLLLALASRPMVVLTRASLLEVVWGREYDVDTRTVDVHINRLRQRIAASNVEIETLRGVGYRLVPPE